MILLNFIKKNHTTKILALMEIIFVDMKGKKIRKKTGLRIRRIKKDLVKNSNVRRPCNLEKTDDDECFPIKFRLL